MKQENKYVKYGLLAGVIAVWGIIAWRVIGGLQPEKPQVILSRPDPPVSFDPAPDSFALRADYPDPFIPAPDSTDMEKDGKLNTTGGATYGRAGIGGGMMNAPGINYGAPAQPGAGPAPEPLTAWLQFNGMIRSGRKKVAIVTIHGTEYLAKEQQKLQDILFSRIDKEEIRVRYKGESFRIKRQ